MLKEAKKAESIKPFPKIVGYYMLWDGINCVALYKKPCWFHRTMVRLVLGLKWEDDK